VKKGGLVVGKEQLVPVGILNWIDDFYVQWNGFYFYYFLTTDFSQSYTDLLNRLRRKTENKFLICFLFRVYSVPFRGEHFNLLTTDLHGPARLALLAWRAR
jgi:hypothetical protein